MFSPEEPGRYRELVETLTNHDHFMVCEDFASFAACQRRVEEKWHDPHAWWRSSVLNTAKVAWFSSDRAMREYCADIWTVPIPPAG